VFQVPEGTPPAPEGSASDEVGGDPIREALGEDIVVHTDPVRIPISALPLESLPPPPGSRFATTFVTGTVASPWIAGALLLRDPIAAGFAVGWGALWVVAFISDLCRRPR
jgi:hypothetical protein